MIISHIHQLSFQIKAENILRRRPIVDDPSKISCPKQQPRSKSISPPPLTRATTDAHKGLRWDADFEEHEKRPCRAYDAIMDQSFFAL